MVDFVYSNSTKQVENYVIWYIIIYVITASNKMVCVSKQDHHVIFAVCLLSISKKTFIKFNSQFIYTMHFK